ncbi:MAG: S9 family peptidase [Candidatus Promineifilaceae bacterium]|nr:S9 family peptidase [Candidatus Promineifilaceae bacterium]
MTSSTQLISPADLYRMQIAGEAQIAPDGRHVLYTVQRVDKEKEKKYTNLWLVPTDGSAPRQFTYGDQTDRQPRWSPDGRQIAFLSNRDDEKQPQLYLLPFGGGEARQLTELKGDFANFQWSPDGTRLVVQFRKKDEEAIEREKDEHLKELGVVARHYTRLFFKLDGSGYLPQERWHLWIIEAESGEARQLTDHPVYDELSPRWTPDGQAIVYLTNRAPDPDLDPEAADVCVIPVEGGEPRRLPTPVGIKYMPAVAPDGGSVAYIGVEGRGDWWKNNGLWVVPLDGSTEARDLMADSDLHVGNGTSGDVAERYTARPIWAPDGQHLYVQLTHHGKTTIHAVPLEGGEPSPVVDADGMVGSVSLDGAGERLAFALTTLDDPVQVWFQTLANGERRQLTRLNQWLDEIDLGAVEEVWFKGGDGNDLQGWILTPPDFDPQRQYPAIIEIHGGPWMQYGKTFMHEFYVLAARGYVVAFSNPRGGRGYGESHAKAIHRAWGTADYADVMAWSDYVAARPYVEDQRLGVTGGSYGGYMTVWIIGHTARFKAAVAQRVVSNITSMVGTSDLNHVFEDAMGGGNAPWEAVDEHWQHSPIAHIGGATTPTLVIHSERDMRTELEQGLQVYVALKRQGVESELVTFPGESHGLSRGGRTDRRIARLEHITRWFDRYLRPAGQGGE